MGLPCDVFKSVETETEGEGKRICAEKKLIASLGEDGEGLARTSPERPSTITELTEHSSTATELLSRGMKFSRIS